MTKLTHIDDSGAAAMVDTNTRRGTPARRDASIRRRVPSSFTRRARARSVSRVA